MPNSYIDTVQRNRITILAVFLVAWGLAASSALGIRIDHDLRAFIVQDRQGDTPFGLQTAGRTLPDTLYFLVMTESGDVFSDESLALIRNLTTAATDLPNAGSVESITTHPLSEALSAYDRGQQTETLRASMLSNRFLVGRTLAPDGSASAVRLTLNFPPIGAGEAQQATVEAARELADRFVSDPGGVNILLAGSVAVSQGLGEAVQQDLIYVTLAAAAAIALLLLATMRSFVGTVAALSVMGLSITLTMGLFAALKTQLTPAAGFVPTAIAAISVADSIHLFFGYAEALRKGMTRPAALRETFSVNYRPVFLTSITSVLGVLFLNFSDSPAFREMGNMIAMGIVMAWVVSMLFWPALMATLPKPSGKRMFPSGSVMQGLGSVVLRGWKVLLIAGLAISLLSGTMIRENRLTERWHEYLDASLAPRQSIDALVKHMGGLHHVYYGVGSADPSGIFSDADMAALTGFAAWYGEQPEVAHVVGMSDAVRMTGEAPEDFPTGELARLLLRSDPAASGLEVVFRPADTATLIGVLDRAEAWRAANVPQLAVLDPLGLDVAFAQANNRNIHGLLTGTALALGSISLVLMLLLRSVPMGLISLIPNILPVALAYGLWGLLDGRLSMATSVVACIGLGLVVDDTVHFLAKYQRARLTSDAPEACLAAYRSAGTAICISSFVLIAGLACVQLSQVLPTRETAFLLSLTIGGALLADLLLLAPLLMLADRINRRTPPASSE